MNSLIEQIEQAFADVAYPGDDDLTDSTYGAEPPALIAEFTGKTDRQKLDAAFLNQAPDGWGTALCFFSDNALRFYLPVYLVADIRGELENPDPVSILCASLTPAGAERRIAKQWGGGTMGERARANFEKCSPVQVAAIVAYLQWKLQAANGYDPLIEQALDAYWLERNSGKR